MNGGATSLVSLAEYATGQPGEKASVEKQLMCVCADI